MDQRLPYEQLIGAKLQDLSLPGLEDRIWARVKAQLDIEMPTDDHDDGGDDVPPAPVTQGPLRWGLSVVLVTLIAAFLFFNNQPTTNEDNRPAPVNMQPAAPPANQPTGTPPGNAILTTAPPLPRLTPAPGDKNSDTVVMQPVLSTPVPVSLDSATREQPDSIVTQAQPPLTLDTIVPKKKGRGVRGLKDDDYRIVPKENQ